MEQKLNKGMRKALENCYLEWKLVKCFRKLLCQYISKCKMHILSCLVNAAYIEVLISWKNNQEYC